MAEKDELRVPLSYIDTAKDDNKGDLALCDNNFATSLQWHYNYYIGGKTGETAITIEPLSSKGHKTEDTLSIVSDAPTVEHFNISVSN